MKIHIPNLSLSAVNEETIKDIPIVDTSKYNEIYTLDGVFVIDKTGIKKKIFEDDKIYSKGINNKNYLIDESRCLFQKGIVSITSENIICSYEKYKYMLRKQSRIWLIVVKEQGKIKELYIETNESIDNVCILEDFSTLVSHIK